MYCTDINWHGRTGVRFRGMRSIGLWVKHRYAQSCIIIQGQSSCVIELLFMPPRMCFEPCTVEANSAYKTLVVLRHSFRSTRRHVPPDRGVRHSLPAPSFISHLYATRAFPQTHAAHESLRFNHRRGTYRSLSGWRGLSPGSRLMMTIRSLPVSFPLARYISPLLCVPMFGFDIGMAGGGAYQSGFRVPL